MTQTNLKPFDLQAALAGKPVQTREGRPVKIAGYNEEATEESQVIGWIEGLCYDWDKNGLFVGDDRDHPEDIFMAPEKREVWVAYWKHGDYRGVSHAYSEQSIKDVCDAHMHEIITTVKIWEEEI